MTLYGTGTQEVHSEWVVTAEFLTHIADGDPDAWQTVVAHYGALVRAAALRAGVGRNDLEDAVQRTWILLLRNARSIKDPNCLPGWLSTTARREAQLIRMQGSRDVPVSDFTTIPQVPADVPDFLARLIQAHRLECLNSAVASLPERQRAIIFALLKGSGSYDRLSTDLGIPRGSLGPTRARALARLRYLLIQQSAFDDSPTAA